MKPYLLDTCILIDFTKAKSEAVALMKGLQEQPSISSMVVAELFAGIKNRKERGWIEQLIEACNIIEVDRSIAELGGSLKSQYGPSHGVGLIDCLLAATAIKTQSTLVTLNLKHFPMLDETSKLRPY